LFIAAYSFYSFFDSEFMLRNLTLSLSNKFGSFYYFISNNAWSQFVSFFSSSYFTFGSLATTYILGSGYLISYLFFISFLSSYFYLLITIAVKGEIGYYDTESYLKLSFILLLDNNDTECEIYFPWFQDSWLIYESFIYSSLISSYSSLDDKSWSYFGLYEFAFVVNLISFYLLIVGNPFILFIDV